MNFSFGSLPPCCRAVQFPPYQLNMSGFELLNGITSIGFRDTASSFSAQHNHAGGKKDTSVCLRRLLSFTIAPNAWNVTGGGEQGASWSGYAYTCRRTALPSAEYSVQMASAAVGEASPTAKAQHTTC